MASSRRGKKAQAPEPESEIFDRLHLSRYTMDCADLEREIVALFLGQVPSILAMIRQADSDASWRLATHTLKGSAAAVGARRIGRIAVTLEGMKTNVDVKKILLLAVDLDKAVAEFRDLTGRIYP